MLGLRSVFKRRKERGEERIVRRNGRVYVVKKKKKENKD